MKLNMHVLQILIVFIVGLTLFSCTSNTVEIISKDKEIYTQLRTDGCGVSYNIPSCDSVQTVNDSLIINGCKFYMSYSYQYCAFGFIYPRLYIMDVDYWPSQESGCTDLHDSWEELFNQGRNVILSNEILSIERSILAYIEQSRVEDYFYNFVSTPCGGIQTFSAEMFLRDCTQYCAYQEGESWNIEIENCGISCCSRVTEWCSDFHTNEVIMVGDPVVESQSDGCVGQNMCSGTSIGDCIEPCEKLQF
ncbi:MAG: hypothetical protein IPN29_13175 [Saprospiraceae bacterium]|nr:hypothetical protein [Saprospiraceae bacterium]